MSTPFLYLPPTRQHEVEFLLAADEWGDPCAMKCFKSALGPPFAGHPPSQNRCREALERARRERRELEEVTENPPRGLGDDHRSVLGEPLQSSREIGCLARYPTFLRLAHTNKVANHHQPRGNANARTKALAGRRQFRNAVDQREPRPDRPLSIVLMGLGVPEVNQRAVAQVFGDKSTMAASYIVDAREIHSQQFPKILGVEARR